MIPVSRSPATPSQLPASRAMGANRQPSSAVAALATVQATKTYSRVTMTKLAQIERGRLRAGSCMSSARKAVISQPV